MKIVLLNQTFYPDVVSTAQHLKDFAMGLAERGHRVSVVASRRAYDDPQKRFATKEWWNGVEIYRIRSTGLGKGAKWKRAVDFGTFLLSCVWRLITVPRPDVIVALTSPPLISFIAACYAGLRRCRFVYWVMDLNPDEAVAAGWLRQGSMMTQVLDGLSRFSFRRAERIIALDRFMAERIAAKLSQEKTLSGDDGKKDDKIEIIAPWSHDDVIRFDGAGREQFRKEQGLNGRFVVMYSGNHSPCHPLTTLLEAARALAEDLRFVFLFVGGGSEWPKVQEFAERHQLANVRSLRYQPLEKLAGSLSAADLHVVVMGDAFVGTIHPCKIYNILSVGAPVLYIGPEQSHISGIFASMAAPREAGGAHLDTATSENWKLQKAASSPRPSPPAPLEEREKPTAADASFVVSARCAQAGGARGCFSARHGEVARVVAQLRAAAEVRGRGDEKVYREVSARFSKERLLPKQVEVVEGLERLTK